MSDDVLLDAAKKCVLAVGVRRTTLAEIARTAKVSRMTVYRRFPDVRSVLATLMTREFGGLLQGAAEPEVEPANFREKLVQSSSAAVAALSGDPLFRTLLDLDSELVLPYIVERLGKTQRFAEGVILHLLKSGQEDGSIRKGDLPSQARTLLLLIQSFAFSYRPATADVNEKELMAEFAHVLDAALRP
ncbi:TetR/AcrR family transcriptional regulator [Amycolatopsis lurida]|uniref:TetR family transcriptional regulator n=1 Tax=Amycolatopsis lurida NRRL 2430 TaxID=1460371 RepID=A0A2P2FY91_AMYLU|nr:TetR/AcrR family transcriptional regulator [Amycolatopsis lurida]KFU81665.1 TetR family transcriptional regulator [Amycolatopsis lurida NRRL 2430]